MYKTKSQTQMQSEDDYRGSSKGPTQEPVSTEIDTSQGQVAHE